MNPMQSALPSFAWIMVEVSRDFWETALSPLCFDVWGRGYDISLYNAYGEFEVHIAVRTQVVVMEAGKCTCRALKKPCLRMLLHNRIWLITQSLFLQRPPRRSRSGGVFSETVTKRREIIFPAMVDCYDINEMGWDLMWLLTFLLGKRLGLFYEVLV